MIAISRHQLVMGIFPTARGFSFALLEGPLAPVDWGNVRIRTTEKNRPSLDRISRLFGQYSPDVVVLQDTSPNGTWRSQRIRDLNEAITALAETQGIIVAAYTRDHVRQCINDQGVRSRYAMAENIARVIPMLRRFIPPTRKIWMAEDPRIGLFEAVGLALVFHSLNDVGRVRPAGIQESPDRSLG